jgi:hypothetical protein
VRPLGTASAFLMGTGLAAAVTAGMGYYTRYSTFDRLYAEVDWTLYSQMTGMTSFEKTAIILGIAALLTGLALSVANLLTPPASDSNNRSRNQKATPKGQHRPGEDHGRRAADG